MVTMESLVKFSGKPEEEIKKEVEAAMKNMNIEGMDDTTKLDFAMNQLHSKYSKEEFKSKSEMAEGFILGDSGTYDNITKIRTDTQEFINKSPEDAKKLNMQDTDGNLLYYMTQQEMDSIPPNEDWKLKNKYREVTPEDKDITPVLTWQGKPMIGMEIPLIEKTRMLYGYHLIDGNWTQFVQKLSYKLTREDKEKNNNRLDNTEFNFSEIKFQQGKFPVYNVENMSKQIGFTYFAGSGKYKFEFIKAMEDKEIEGILATQQAKTITLSDLDKYTSIKGNDFVIIKARVHDIGVLDSGAPVIKVQDDTLNLGEKDEKGERITPVSCYLPSDYKPMFGDGSEVTLFGKPRVSEKGIKSMRVYGLYVPSIYKTQIPKPDSVEL